MNKPIWIFISVLALIFISFKAEAQNKKQINWNQSVLKSTVDPNSEGNNRLLSFDGATYSSLTDDLPKTGGIVAITGNADNNNWTVELSNAVFEPIPDDQISLVRGKNISEQIKINVSKQISRKTSYLAYDMIPLRRNPNTGQLERLISYTPLAKITSQPLSEKKSLKISRNYSNSSVLASGNWYKIRVSRTGIHKISYDDLTSLGITDPSSVKIFGNGGKQLPYDSSKPKVDDLKENPIYIETGSDGTFNSGDFLLFYAQGPVSWSYNQADKMFIHHLNNYSDYAYYFITTDAGSGKRVGTAELQTGSTDFTTDTYDEYQYKEKDSVNLIKSGRLWCWTHFSIDLDRSYSFNFPNRVQESPVKMISHLLSHSNRASNDSRFHLVVDDQIINSFNMPGVNTNNYEALYASDKREKSVFTPNGGSFRLDIKYERFNPDGKGWLDYLILNTRSKLRFRGEQMNFRDMESVASGAKTKFNIENNGENIQVWDVSNFESVTAMPLNRNGGTSSFITSTDKLKEFIVFNPQSGNIPIPEYKEEGLGQIQNQNLHGKESPDMIIIVHDLLREYAEDLALFHLENDGLESLIVSPDQIYNEFSSGALDATAIRDFIKMFYDRAGSDLKLKYLLLFGDGSYDNKNINKEYPACIPTFQSEESLYPTTSYVTDDYYGLLDDGENLEPGLLDIGIGRFPVTNPFQASVMVDKVKHYKDEITYGDWRNLVCFIGDDEDGNGHMEDANTLAVKVNQNFPNFNVDKIFLDAYQQVTVPAGDRYPEVNRAINDRIKKGALIMNYLGHGSERGLAAEEIVKTSDIQSWDNYYKLPLFITATCEFSRFDDHELTSAGEWVLLNPSGGGIGLFTTTRLVYSSPNFRLNKVLYDYIFERTANGGKYTFGDIMLHTKNAIGTELNKLNFTLLSDPALSLNFPDNRIIMTEINGKDVGEFSDTLKALSQATVRGYVADLQGNKIENFNGTVTPSVFDKDVILTNLANDGGPIMEFSVQENILFRGKVSVNQGDFKFSFIVPKDIAYNIGYGKFSFYGSDGSSDANGSEMSVLIGGSADSVYTDQLGPDVRLFMNDTSFVFGGLTNENPVFLARLSDQYGINTVGNGIGHDITAVLDNNNQSVLVLNDYYESDLDNYKSGTIRYPLQDLDPGTHTMKLKVWDILNNSTESEIQFEVIGSERLELKNIINYPNPFTTHTEFYFEHNQANQMLDVQIQVFTVSGRIVKSFSFLTADNTNIDNDSFRVGPIAWDGLDDFGDRIGRGTYIYRVRVRTPDGRYKEGFQKLVILR